ncbi:hypothetical protein AKJ09_04224 [Labilithrix luteola]|uniref:Uncharacterized protein n=1 Tax=Labilithrix luteola TaxID=1391654 RepID=A0A0K1PVK5_9BACT|nr:hypothetical protein AKJ09_04224 [Labilithrix luteola]
MDSRLTRLASVFGFSLTMLCVTDAALAQTSEATPTLPTPAPKAPAASPFAPVASSTPSPNATAKGVAVLSLGEAREEAFMLARAVYASRLRPPTVDEAHARVLAGEAPAENAVADVRELAELRAAITGDDAPSRRLLGSLADQLHVSGLLVVTVETPPQPPAPAADAGAPAAPNAPAIGAQAVTARLFLPDTREFDAARYSPEPGVRGPQGWRSVVSSVERRFPSAAAPAPAGGTVAAPAAATRPSPPAVMRPHEEEAKPFYASPWFWGRSVLLCSLVGVFTSPPRTQARTRSILR